MGTKLNHPLATVIACTQCRATLYHAEVRDYSPDHHSVNWKPVPHGSRNPPKYPLKFCPYCHGSTIQKANRHGE